MSIDRLRRFIGDMTSLVGGDSNVSAWMALSAGLLVAIPVCMIVGWTAERVAYRPLRRAPRLAALITAIGVSIILQNLAMMIWGRNYMSFPQVIHSEVYTVMGARVSGLQIAIVIIAGALIAIGA